MQQRVLNFRALYLPLTLLLLCSWLIGCQWLTPKVNPVISELRAGEYQLDPQHASLLFQISHLGISTYVGRFNHFSATLDFNPLRMQDTRLDGLVDMSSIDINNPDLAETLRDKPWLDSTTYPQAHFTTREVTPLDNQRFLFTGNLDWRGINQPVTLAVTFHGGADNWLSGHYTLGFSAEGTFRRSLFGMDKYIPLVGDEVTILIFAEFQQR